MSWYKRSQQSAEIYMEEYKNSLWRSLIDTVESSQRRIEEISTMNVNKTEFINSLNSLNYPVYQEIINNYDSLSEDIYDRFEKWFWNSYLYGENKYDIEFRNRGKYVLDTMESLSGSSSSSTFTQEQALELFNELVDKTQVEQIKTKNLIESSIRGIPGFSSSVIIGVPSIDRDYNYEYGEDTAQIYLNNLSDGPMFSLFKRENDTFIIDDIADSAEDIEFFIDEKTKRDYYQLVNKMQNIGKNQKPITLYTARPVRDRSIYENSNSVPSNIYLTSNYGRAEGIALELSGSEKYRDIWRVKINPQYLIVTYDGGSFKDYQTIGDKYVPVERLSLISTGE